MIKLNRLIIFKNKIFTVVSIWTSLPLHKISQTETDLLLKLESTLSNQIVGQTSAITSLSSSIRRARVGLKSPQRPIASFFFSGPSGVGKSALAKAVSAFYFGAPEAMI